MRKDKKEDEVLKRKGALVDFEIMSPGCCSLLDFDILQNTRVALFARADFLHPCLFFGDLSADIKNHRAEEAEFDSVIEAIEITVERHYLRYTGSFCCRQQ